MDDVLERVRRLLASTRSSAENEGRNAAVQVCKAILEHGLVVLTAAEHDLLVRAMETLRLRLVQEQEKARDPVKPERVLRPSRRQVRSRRVPEIVGEAVGEVASTLVESVLGGRRR